MNKKEKNSPVLPSDHKLWLNLRKDEIDNYLYQCIQFNTEVDQIFIHERNTLIQHIEAYNKQDADEVVKSLYRNQWDNVQKKVDRVNEIINSAENTKYAIEESIMNGEQLDLKVEPCTGHNDDFYRFLARMLKITPENKQKYIDSLEVGSELILMTNPFSNYFFIPAQCRAIYASNPELNDLADNGLYINLRGEKIVRIKDKKTFKTFLESI